ncbi:MAG: Asp-tRNA(Asn)/Glu-tRNA(Gln) amidotransferase subunit GatC [Proteobacteria bacterium]|nr:MAG: Asp-tRNA(Asn)/Glu-tRNA(Gln) amidotransferase subunit GatC [Pseudomonadota bacterium]
MQIDRQTVEKVARLAHIQLSEEEIEYYQGQLGSVLDYMQQIQSAADQLPAEWRADIAGTSCPERLDEAKPSQIIEKVLQSAPKVVGTAFQVPRIIE